VTGVSAQHRLGTIGEALEAIEQIAKHAIHSSPADALVAAKVIAVIVDTVRLGLNGELEPDAVEAEIASLRCTVLGDERIDAKFDRS
jgi:hypothetical protein